MSDNPHASVPAPKTKPRPPRKWGEIVVALGIVAIIAVILLPGVSHGPRAPRRLQCKNNLKQLGLALHNYHDQYGSFPPPFTLDDEGRRLHSWRVLVLPFAEQGSLFRKLDLTKPWNHPANAEVRDSCPDVFRCRAAELPPGYTTYKAAVGPDAAFDPAGGTRRIDDMLDGTSQTVLVVEATRYQASHWMDPYDDDGLAVLMSLSANPETPHRSTINSLFADGSCHSLAVDTKSDVLRGLTTIAGGETIDIDEF